MYAFVPLLVYSHVFVLPLILVVKNIIFDEKSKETMVIDPAGDVDRIVEMIEILGGKLKYIYLYQLVMCYMFNATYYYHIMLSSFRLKYF